CETVAFAHARGIIHRDLKPANVMVGQFGEVQVMDWGLAKVVDGGRWTVNSEKEPGRGHAGPASSGATDHDSRTEVGSVLGTFAYMPPEQARGDTALVDPCSDVFGLGAVLCKILTDEPPYVGPREQLRDQSRAGDTAPALARLDCCEAEGELIALA